MHYFEAGELKEAYYFSVQSAIKAKAAYSNESAAKFFEQAINVGSHLENPDPTLSKVHQDYSEVLELLGYMESAIVSWEQAWKRRCTLGKRTFICGYRQAWRGAKRSAFCVKRL